MGIDSLVATLVAMNGLGLLLLILAVSRLSRRQDDDYDDLLESEDMLRDLVSKTWRYTEAVDDAAANGAGNTLYLQRMRDRQAGACRGR